METASGKVRFVPVRELAHGYPAILDELSSSRRPAIVTRNGVPVATLLALDQGILGVLQDYVLLHAPEYVAAADAADADLAAGRARDGDEMLGELLGEGPPETELPLRSIGSAALDDTFLEAIRRVVRSELEHVRESIIQTIEAIGPTYGAGMGPASVTTSGRLVRWANTPWSGEKPAAEVEVIRIKGVRKEHSELLEAAGVASAVELAHRVPEHLHAKMQEVNKAKRLVRRTPSLPQVESWVAEAKSMPEAVTH